MLSVLDFEFGNLYSLDIVSQRDLLTYIDTLSAKDDVKISFISRLPHRRLVEYFDIQKVQSFWLTKKTVSGSIKPDLADITAKVVSICSEENSVFVIEGIEWLISIHGFPSVHSMIHDLSDYIIERKSTILLSLAIDILNDVDRSRWASSVKELKIDNSIKVDQEVIGIIEESEPVEKAIAEEGRITSLSYLTPISKEGFSKEILRKRMLQWRRMDLDVSELDPALYMSDDEKSYELYKTVEMKVRRAIELDKRIDILDENGWKSDVIKLRFRVRQLTGFDEVEAKIDELI